MQHPTTQDAKDAYNKLHQSCSDTTAVPKSASTTTTIAVKRRSLGSLKSLNNKQHTSPSEKPLIWRSPGVCEIPDILGKAYLQPIQPPPKPAIKKQATTPAIVRPPWYPACGSNWTPSPPTPVIKPDETLFEKRLRKAIPKITLTATPKSRFIGSKEIGTGVNGAVIQVTVRGSNTRLALKRCKLDYDREYRAAIVRELRIMATGHNNLIKLKEAAVYKNEVWIAMDLMQCSVFAVLCCRSLPEEFAIYIARETLNALAYLHTKGFIHRDVKCENLLISHTGEIKLADFGLATSTKHVNQERLGTAKWMAPEVIQEHPYCEKADLWSLGITLIEMMDRVPPHYSTKRDEEVFQKILDEPSPTFNYSYPTIYCTGLVAWLLEENPENRPSAKDVMMELDLHVEQKLLKTSNAQHLSNFVNKTLHRSMAKAKVCPVHVSPAHFIKTPPAHFLHWSKVDCPDHGYKCPTCENKQVCAYPSSFGCEGNVGVPVCKAICPGVICSPIALPCPDECPFNCEYHGPPCCPFLGQPTCLPPCNTLVPCHVTPCPDECKDDCFYPNADRCCPREGQPVCRSELKGPTPSKFTKRSVLEEASPPSTQTKIDGREICVDMIVPCPPECPNDCEYPTDVPCPLTHKPKCRSTTNADQVADHHPEQVDEWMDLLSQEGKLTVPMKEFLMQSHTLLQWVDDQHIMNDTNRPLP